MLLKTAVVWFAATLALAVASRWQVASHRIGRCSFDGRTIESIHQIDLVESVPGGAMKTIASFCSYTCALAWPDVPTDAHWQVRDEGSGEVIDASQASFVASRADSPAARGERIHAFRHWSDAMNHAAAFGGAALDNPLARRGAQTVAPKGE
jgi:hypothetical protein